MSLGQGVLMVLAGAAAERFQAADVIAVCGAAGAVTAMIIALDNARTRDAPGFSLTGH